MATPEEYTETSTSDEGTTSGLTPQTCLRMLVHQVVGTKIGDLTPEQVEAIREFGYDPDEGEFGPAEGEPLDLWNSGGQTLFCDNDACPFASARLLTEPDGTIVTEAIGVLYQADVPCADLELCSLGSSIITLND